MKFLTTEPKWEMKDLEGMEKGIRALDGQGQVQGQ